MVSIWYNIQYEHWQHSMNMSPYMSYSLHNLNILYIRILIGFMVTAAVTIDTMRNMRLCDLRHPVDRETKNVSITFEKQCITSSSCESCPKCWCPHVIAAAIHRIKHAHEVWNMFKYGCHHDTIKFKSIRWSDVPCRFNQGHIMIWLVSLVLDMILYYFLIIVVI